RRGAVSHHGARRHAADSHRAAGVDVSVSRRRVPLAPGFGRCRQMARRFGVRKQYVLLAPCELWANFDRIGCPPWGVQGARAAKSGQVLVYKNGNAEPEMLYKTENRPLDAGDRVRMSTGGGGGYGDPRERPVELVQRDVIRGF